MPITAVLHFYQYKKYRMCKIIYLYIPTHLDLQLKRENRNVCKHYQNIKKNHLSTSLKVALQIFRRKFFKSTKKSSLYSQSLFIFIHKTALVKYHLTTREIRDLLWLRSTLTGNTVYFYMSSLFFYILKIHRQSFKHRVQ